MKKSTLAIGVIVILGLGYTGASWYTGTTIENKFDESITQINDYIHSNTEYSDVSVEYSDYSKGVFSTMFNLKIVEKEFNRTIFNEPVTIYHGPLPWSQLKSGDFSPKMASLVYQTSKESDEQLWQAAGNKPFITVNSTIDYNENANITITNEQLNYSNPNNNIESVKITPSTLSASIDNATGTVSIESKIKQIQYRNAYSNENVEINNIDYSGKYFVQNYPAYQGKQNILIDNLIVKDGKNELALNHIAMINEDNNLNDQLKGKLLFSIENIVFGQQNLGKIDSELNYGIENVRSELSTMSIELNKLLWQTQKGELSASLSLDVEGQSFEYRGLTEDNLNLAQVKVNLPVETLSYLVAQMMDPSKSQPSEEELKQATQMVEFVVMMGGSSPLIDVNQERISTDIYYSKEQNQAKINGNELKIGEFWRIINGNSLPNF